MNQSRHTLEKLIELYLVSCQVEGKSSNTLRAYRETLELFMRAARELNLPSLAEQIKAEHIYEYLSWVMHRGVSLPTRHRRFREVRGFFTWCLRMAYIQEHPFKAMRNIRLGQKIVQPFSPEEVQRLLNADYPTAYLEARNKAIIWLLLDTGIRLNELCSLMLEDLDMSTQRLKVLQGKGNKQRVVRAGDDAMPAVLNYIDHYRGLQPGPLFLTDERGPVSRNAVRVMLARLGERAGVSKVHPHRFRHTFATWAIENEAREIDVQYLLGHSTPAMVTRYAATYNSEKAAQAHARWSPGGILAKQMLAGAGK